jgi:hypothetical protein
MDFNVRHNQKRINLEKLPSDDMKDICHLTGLFEKNLQNMLLGKFLLLLLLQWPVTSDRKKCTVASGSFYNTASIFSRYFSLFHLRSLNCA